MIRFVTTHFNPNKSLRMKRTWFEWFDTLPSYVQENLFTFELVPSGEKPEIPGSHVLHLPSSSGVMWRKEMILNYALECTNAHLYKYFCILDHDMVFDNDHWFLKGMEHLLIHNHVAVQLMQHISYENPQREICYGISASTLVGPKNSNPGGPTNVDAEIP